MGVTLFERGFNITAAIEPASIGSPSAVPVPWASTSISVSGGEPDRSIAALISRRWARPFGAVSEALLPSQRTAAPSSTTSSLTSRGLGDNNSAPTASERQ